MSSSRISHPLLTPDGVTLGLGLLSIGRSWGLAQGVPPDEASARKLLEGAFTLGVRVFDTAPAYAESEARFGDFLRSLGRQASEVLVATKMGQEWEPAIGDVRRDHSADGLKRSIERSLKLLGRIDLLQVHSASVEVLRSDGLAAALEHAGALGVTTFGASISDVATAEAACASGVYRWLQMPFSQNQQVLQPVFAIAQASGVRIMVNRPFAMGHMLADPVADKHAVQREALSFIRGQGFDGCILTGTRSVAHLAESLVAFEAG